MTESRCYSNDGRGFRCYAGRGVVSSSTRKITRPNNAWRSILDNLLRADNEKIESLKIELLAFYTYKPSN